MGRWTQYDEDDYRLPEGMKRIGYDADSGRYYFRDSDGSTWQGGVGATFGEMSKVRSLPSSIVLEDAEEDNDEGTSHQARRGGDDVEASPRTRNGAYELLSEDDTRPMIVRKSVNPSSYRTLFPFFLIIAVVLLLVWRLLIAPALSTAPATKKCPEGTSSHWIQPGDNCWELAKANGWMLEKFKEANPKVVCDPLMPGTSVCLPDGKKTKRRRL